MKKLYLASVTINTIFQSEDDLLQPTFPEPMKSAKFFLQKEFDANPPFMHFSHNDKIFLKEIKSLEDIPKEWEGGLIWGTDDEIYPDTWIQENTKMKDPEYQNYLCLKKKYEDEGE